MLSPCHFIRNGRRRGFTLVEALVALTLSGLITAGVAFALRTSLDASARIRERADTHAEGRAALGQLTADLSGAYLSGVNTEKTLFVARSSSEVSPGEPFLSFTALSGRRSRSAAPDTPHADLVRVEYALQPPSGDGAPGAALVRRERWLTESGPGMTDVVCERVMALHLRYLDGSDFQEEWDASPETDQKLRVVDGEEEPSSPSSRKLPRAVEVVLLLAPVGETARDKPRVYKTLAPLRADGVFPFETEVDPPQPAAQEQAPGQAPPTSARIQRRRTP